MSCQACLPVLIAFAFAADWNGCQSPPTAPRLCAFAPYRSIDKCKKAIEVGRSVRADYKIVAKSYARIGNAYNAMGNLDEAIRAYEVRC